jgi:hypothetical protein
MHFTRMDQGTDEDFQILKRVHELLLSAIFTGFHSRIGRGLPKMPSWQRLLDWHCDCQSCQRRLGPRVARLVADFATRKNACMHVGVGYALPDRPR